MDHTPFKEFGELYKAAFAEREPVRKLSLLKQVKDAIETWERQDPGPIGPPRASRKYSATNAA